MICDLGISKIKESINTLSITHNPKGTPLWMAPENYEMSYGTHSDVFSFGCVLFELLTDELPWSHDEIKDKEHLKMKILSVKTKNKKKGKKPTIANKEELMKNSIYAKFIIVIEKCLQRDPKKRPSAAEIKEMLLTVSHNI
jgi:serine/threonine protein kinase